MQGHVISLLLAPDVANPLVGDRCVDNRVRDRAMPHEGLQRPCIDSTARQGTRYATCAPNHKVILLQVPRNRSRRGEPSPQSSAHVNDFTATCDLPAQGAGSGGTPP